MASTRMSHLQRFSPGRGARSQLCRRLCSTMLAISSIHMAPRLCLRRSRASQFWSGTGPGSSVGSGTYSSGARRGVPHGTNFCSGSQGVGAMGHCEPGWAPGRGQIGGRAAERREGANERATNRPKLPLRQVVTLRHAGVPPRVRRGSWSPLWGMRPRSGVAPAKASHRHNFHSQSPGWGIHQRIDAN